jgi:CMP-N,N'-diacetyllegionaminic acid synthase
MNIALIPARGGSKGVPRKNIKLLLDQPLIAHSIEQCLSSKAIDQVFVSTDDDEIAEISQRYGADIIWRPAEISGDTASSETALIHGMAELQGRSIAPDYVFFLQCTSPIRAEDDLDRAFQQLQSQQADSLLTVSPSHSFFWQHNDNGDAIAVNYDYKNRPRRQDMEPQYKENGSFYIFTPSVLSKYENRLGGKITMYEMPEECAYEIDSEVDFTIIESLIKVD